MRKYVGITIGPILDTLEIAESPASLWFASMMFSDITKRLCDAIKSNSVLNSNQPVEICSPYFGNDVVTDDGIGKFHDRIIFVCDQFDDTALKDIIATVKKETLVSFGFTTYDVKQEMFLMEYLQIHYAVIDEVEVGEQNCILVLSPYLDALELMKTFPSNNHDHPVRDLFFGQNQSIKDTDLFHKVDVSKNQLCNDKGNIWSIAQIARGSNFKMPSNQKAINSKLKSLNYFAVVQADGDRMGEKLKNLSKIDDIKSFSETCLEYTKEASTCVRNFGGMMIYAGGDDLLFLAPVVNKAGRDIFSLCNEINEIFKMMMDSDHVSVSFGISIQYKKSPLYEASKSALNLLFTKAKNGEKNQMAIQLQKHSGQSLNLLISHNDYERFNELLTYGNDQDEMNQTVHSIIYTLEKFKDLFVRLNSRALQHSMSVEEYQLVFGNFFDNSDQKYALDYIKKLADIMYEELTMSKVNVKDKNKKDQETLCQYVLEQIIFKLRMKKFMVEKGDEHE